MTSPAGHDPGMMDWLLDFAQHYLPLPLVTLLGGLIWRASSRSARFDAIQIEHAERIREHAADIANLKSADAAARVIVAGLPTKDDLRAQTVQLQNQMQTGFDTIARMMNHRD